MPTSLRDELGVDFGSVRDSAGELGFSGEFSLRDVLAKNAEPVTFSEIIVTEDALGGHHELRIFRNGDYRFSGHLRATAWPSFQLSLVSSLGIPIPAEGIASSLQLGFHEHGRAHGSNEFGGRALTWNRQGSNEAIAAMWPNFRHGGFQHRLTYKANYIGDIGDVGSRIAAIVSMGVLFGATGAAIAIAGDAAELAGLDELVIPGLVGVVMSAGAAFLITPGLMIPVFLAGTALTAAAIKQRELEQHERDFADAVFDGQIDYDRILLTNLSGLGGRAFVAPGPGSVIFVNIGQGAYNKPKEWAFNSKKTKARPAGHLFIHELTHAWQICNDSFTPMFYCESLVDQAWAQSDRPAVYNYGQADRAWSGFNVEQQANIVADWFVGNRIPLMGRAQDKFPPMNQAGNPFWRYVRDHVRAGIA